MTLHTEAEAKAKVCPIARVSGAEKPKAHCQGAACILWRWVPISTTEPGFKEALLAAQDMLHPETGKPIGIKAAPAYVNANREAFGLPTEPWRGYCGIGGRPEA